MCHTILIFCVITSGGECTPWRGNKVSVVPIIYQTEKFLLKLSDHHRFYQNRIKKYIWQERDSKPWSSHLKWDVLSVKPWPRALHVCQISLSSSYSIVSYVCICFIWSYELHDMVEWYSGRMLACRAGSQCSIPGWCNFYQNIFFIFNENTILQTSDFRKNAHFEKKSELGRKVHIVRKIFTWFFFSMYRMFGSNFWYFMLVYIIKCQQQPIYKEQLLCHEDSNLRGPRQVD